MRRKVLFALAGMMLATAAEAQVVEQLPSFNIGGSAAPAAPATPAPAPARPQISACPDDGTISLECVVNFGKFDQTTEVARIVTEAAAVEREAVRTSPTPVTPPALPQIDIEIQFAYDSFQLTPQAIAQLAPLAVTLSDPAVRGQFIMIVGHTDGVGGYDYNQTLSERRAQTVANHVSAITGIPRSQFLPVGMGFKVLKYPLDPRAAGNRRVTVAWASNS